MGRPRFTSCLSVRPRPAFGVGSAMRFGTRTVKAGTRHHLVSSSAQFTSRREEELTLVCWI